MSAEYIEVQNNRFTIKFAFGDVEFGGSMIEEQMQREVVKAYESPNKGCTSWLTRGRPSSQFSALHTVFASSAPTLTHAQLTAIIRLLASAYQPHFNAAIALLLQVLANRGADLEESARALALADTSDEPLLPLLAISGGRRPLLALLLGGDLGSRAAEVLRVLLAEAFVDALVDAGGESLLRFLPLLLEAAAAKGERLSARTLHLFTPLLLADGRAADVFPAALVHSPGLVDTVFPANFAAALARQKPLPAHIHICRLLPCQGAPEIIRGIVLGTISAGPVAVTLAEGALLAFNRGQPLPSDAADAAIADVLALCRALLPPRAVALLRLALAGFFREFRPADLAITPHRPRDPAGCAPVNVRCKGAERVIKCPLFAPLASLAPRIGAVFHVSAAGVFIRNDPASIVIGPLSLTFLPHSPAPLAHPGFELVRAA
jgi:hypothetical protein